jgi:ankyrin repeat protein
MAAAFMGQGNNPSRGRWKTEADGVACLKLLMEAGADVNARNAQGQTALHVAAQRGYNNIVKLLAERGADLMAKDADGHSALDYATGLPNPRGPKPEPQKETVTLLGQLIAAKPATTAKR